MPRGTLLSDQNRLLAALPRQDYRRLAKYLEPVSLTFGQVLYGPGKAAEVGMVGNEGVVGASAALGIDVSNLRAVVQGAGTAVRITASRLRRELRAQGDWYRELFRFTHALMAQVAQTAACNRFHKIEPRLARWLLTTRDRVHSNRFQLTHQFLSLMLGVRRVGVTAAATSLQRRGLISYRRGNIELLDPRGLEAAACGCYRAVTEMHRSSRRT